VLRKGRQQEESLPDREDRFSALIDAGTGAPDAAVSTTALHWLPEPDLRALYAELAAVLRPGGLLLDGDHFTLDAKESPTLRRPAPGLEHLRTSARAQPDWLSRRSIAFSRAANEVSRVTRSSPAGAAEAEDAGAENEGAS
jgi:Methyltransferase domain